jgi:hypothetical protein
LNDLIALDDALTRLAALDPRQSEIIELRFFGGLSDAEVAEAIPISGRADPGGRVRLTSSSTSHMSYST